MDANIEVVDSQIGHAQAVVAKFLTSDVVKALETSALSAVEQARAGVKAEGHLKALADTMYRAGVRFHDIGLSQPKGLNESPEQEIVRVEFTRQIVEDYLEKRYPKAWITALGYDLDGRKAEVNKKRKKDGLSNLSAAEMQVAGLLPEGTIVNRKAANDLKSNYLRRLAGYLKALDPKVEVEDPEVTDDSGEEDIEPTPTGKTPVQKAIDAGNAFAKALRNTDVPDDAIAMVYQLIALLGGTPESE